MGLQKPREDFASPGVSLCTRDELYQMIQPLLRSFSYAFTVGVAVSIGMMIWAFTDDDYDSPWIVITVVCLGNAYYLRRKSREK